MLTIKICGDPHCEAVWHNCPKEQTHCKSCGGNMMKINYETYRKKFANNFFQYDYATEEYYRPQTSNRDAQGFLLDW